MKRHMLAGLTAAGFIIAGGLAVAHINGPLDPHGFKTACNGVGGALANLTSSGNVTSGSTCTWETVSGASQIVVSRDVPGRDDNGDWTLLVQTIVRHVATWNNASASGIGNVDTNLGQQVIACYNPGGASMDLGHQHCQLP